ncbi:uncharacterized protein LOC141855859 [Brevipalpus obovatus]|uniref:uncharacterized protein LOC141855859 n=1 Tax=Brevipalpus obovatus TaxID=246614 RepID=UPI003D9ED5ED
MNHMALREEDTEERLYRLRDENYALRKQASSAGNNVKILTSKLGRLLEEKKRLLKKEKTRKEVSLEETIKDLEMQISTLVCENQRLRERELLLRTKLDHNHHLQMQRSPYAHVKSRTDSGLGDHFSIHGRRLGPHNRSMSSISLNRVTFTTTATSADKDDDHDDHDEDSLRVRRDFPHTSSKQHEAENCKTVPKKSKKLQRPCTGKRNPQASLGNNNSVDNFILQLFKESQQEIIKLRELLTNYQQSMPNIAPENSRIISTAKYHEPIDTSRSQSSILPSSSDQITLLNGKSDQAQKENSLAPRNQPVTPSDKMIQVFDHVEKSLAPSSSSSSALFGEKLEENLSFGGLPMEVTKYIEKLSGKLSEAQETVKNMEKKAIMDRSISLKLQEYEQKVENLKNEKVLLQKSLDECIGTCVNGIIKESWGDDNIDGVNQSAMERSAITQCSQECVERIEIMENQLKSQQEQYKLLESRYQKLETLYNLLIDQSSSPIQDHHVNMYSLKYDIMGRSSSNLNTVVNGVTNIAKPKSDPADVLRRVREEREAILKDMKIMVDKVENDLEN